MFMFDAIVSGIIFKYFGDKGIMIIVCMCALALIRISMRASRHFDMFEDFIYLLYEEENKDENN